MSFLTGHLFAFQPISLKEANNFFMFRVCFPTAAIDSLWVGKNMFLNKKCALGRAGPSLFQGVGEN